MDEGFGLPPSCFDQGFDILDFFLCSHALLDVTEITALHSVLVSGCMNQKIKKAPLWWFAKTNKTALDF